MPDLVPHVRAGDTVMWGQAHGQPLTLIRALIDQRHQIGKVRVFLGIGHALEDVLKPEHADGLEFFSYCGTGSNRELLRGGVLDILPLHFSDMARRFHEGSMRADVLLLKVPPPDEQGRFSLGMARDFLAPALPRARALIAEVDQNLPWTHGGPYLVEKDFDLLVHAGDPWQNAALVAPSAVELAIGRHVASLVPDRATLQVGIGNVPDATLAALKDHRDLGVHSGILGDGLAILAEAGVINNSRKSIDTGITVAAMAMGGEKLRRYLHNNPAAELRGVDYTHDAGVLSRLERFVAINSAVEVDLTGQVNSEVAAGAYVGTVGGLPDFIRAAQCSVGGVPIIALPSTARASSRIVSSLSGPVSLQRSDAGVIVTEHGVADLRGLSISQRIDRMIAIADPAHREGLQDAVRETSRARRTGSST